MSDYNLGTARGVIQIDYDGKGAKQASEGLKEVGASAESAEARASKASGTLAKMGAVVAVGLGVAVKSAADFEKGLSNVQAVSGATQDEMEQIRAKALQLGKDTQFSASESAAAIEELVKAGLSVGDVMNGAADATVALAAAGEVSMPEAAAIASNAMNQFGLAAKQMPKVADAIAGAANASAIDVADFGMSLSQVGAVANLAGANFEETSTAIALLGNAGIKGSDAGTSLKSMLMNLQPETDKAANSFENLGLLAEDGSNKFYDAEGNMKSLAEVSGLLADGLKGMSKAEQMSNLEEIFGSDGLRAAAILGDEGAKGFEKMASAMGKVTAAEVAEARMDNLAGSMEQLKGSIETLMIMVGAPLLNMIRTLVDGFTGLLDVVLSLPSPVLEILTVFSSVLSGGLLLAAGFLKMRAAVLAFQAGAMLLSGPILLIVTAIAGLVAAFAYFYKTNDRFRAFVEQMGASLRESLGAAIEWLVPKLKQFGVFLTKVFQASLPYLKQFGEFMVEAFQASLPMIQKVLAILGKFAAVFVDDILPVVVDVAQMIGSSLIGAFQKVAPHIPPLINGIKDFVGAVIGLASAIMATPAFQFLVRNFQVMAGVLTGTVIPLLLRLGGIFTSTFINVIGNALRTGFGIVKGILSMISGTIKIFTGILRGDWSKAWEGVKQVLRGAVSVLGSILRGFLGVAGAIIRGIGAAIVAGVRAIPGMLRGLGALFHSAGRFIIEQFVQGIKNAAGLISGIAGNIWDFVRGLLNGAIGQINNALEFSINPPGPGKISVNPPDIPALATGGVLTAPTMAWVAEAGEDEAVVPLRNLWRQMDKVYRAGRTTLEDPETRHGARGEGSGTGGGSSRARIVEGNLSIDRSGRAWIRGIAEDVADGNERFESAYGRMVR